MQTAKKLNITFNAPENSQHHSARLKDILLSKNYSQTSQPLVVEYEDISLESRIQAENELEQALIKMFGYQ